MTRKVLFIIFIPLSLIAQDKFNYKITYTEKLNFDIEVTKTTELYFNNSNTYYCYKANKTKFDVGDDKIRKYDVNNEIIHTDFKRDSLFRKYALGDSKHVIFEKINKIDWKIYSKEKMKILGFKATKAIGTFRGRIYTVWFTEEIPTTSGPWKLNGLPGLILEAKDSLNQVFFIVEKIETFKSNEASFYKLFTDRSYKLISLKDFVYKYHEIISKQIKKIISKLPRGSKVSGLSISKKTRGIELRYEWEKD